MTENLLHLSFHEQTNCSNKVSVFILCCIAETRLLFLCTMNEHLWPIVRTRNPQETTLARQCYFSKLRHSFSNCHLSEYIQFPAYFHVVTVITINWKSSSFGKGSEKKKKTVGKMHHVFSYYCLTQLKTGVPLWFISSPKWLTF